MSSVIKTSGLIQYKVTKPGTSGLSVDDIIDSTGIACSDTFTGLKVQRIADNIQYLTFTPESGTVSVTPLWYGWNATTREYSIDNGATWNTWDGSSAVTGMKVMFRGIGGTECQGDNVMGVGWAISGTNVSIKGNIETVLDYEEVLAGNHPTMASLCYTHVFSGNRLSLISASELQLPATALTNSCYSAMFYNCTSLTTPPALPATTLANSCYQCMFDGCSSLTTVPLLPAVTLADYCYNQMFDRCTSLYVSDTSGSGYDKAWTIPSSGTFTNTLSQSDMFTSCLGTRSSDSLAGESGQSYTYYTQNTPV